MGLLMTAGMRDIVFHKTTMPKIDQSAKCLSQAESNLR
jgi:hypothetical protein